MKYLGIDFGTKRTGLATSDESGSFAFPHSIVSGENAVETISDIVKKENIETVVIGASVATNEQANELQAHAERFAKKLSEAVEVSIVFEREDFSTVEAHRYQTERGARDDSAAAIILQRFLDKNSKK